MLYSVCLMNLPLFVLSDPSIKPQPTPDVDPTMFEKRFLRKIRDLGEVQCCFIRVEPIIGLILLVIRLTHKKLGTRHEKWLY